MSGYANIEWAVDMDGHLRHIDEVPNGLECDCFCPDPTCDQPLVAKNRGLIVTHHFAHQRGTCEWAVENVVVRLLEDILTKIEAVTVPPLTYDDPELPDPVEVSPAVAMEVASVRLESFTGRGAPEMVLELRPRSGGGTHRCVGVATLAHPLREESREALRKAAPGVVHLDLSGVFAMLRDRDGIHYDRDEGLRLCQDPAFLTEVLADDDTPLKEWAWNRKAALLQDKAERAHRAKVERYRQEQERRRKEAEERRERERQREEELRRERERRAAEEAARHEAHQKYVEEEADRFLALIETSGNPSIVNTILDEDVHLLVKGELLQKEKERQGKEAAAKRTAEERKLDELAAEALARIDAGEEPPKVLYPASSPYSKKVQSLIRIRVMEAIARRVSG